MAASDNLQNQILDEGGRPPLHGEDHSKDTDSRAASIRTRWERGFHDAANLLARRPWRGQFDPMEGFVLHEAAAGHLVGTGR
jgi:NTE family protein